METFVCALCEPTNPRPASVSCTNGCGRHVCMEHARPHPGFVRPKDPLAGGLYAGLGERVRDRLIAELSPAMDTSQANELKQALDRAFDTALAQEHIFLSRSERQRLFEQVMADISSGGEPLVCLVCYNALLVSAAGEAVADEAPENIPDWPVEREPFEQPQSTWRGSGDDAPLIEEKLALRRQQGSGDDNLHRGDSACARLFSLILLVLIIFLLLGIMALVLSLKIG
jgi:hypothetical protein